MLALELKQGSLLPPDRHGYREYPVIENKSKFQKQTSIEAIKR